ncbi:hypothetical protein JCM11251_004773 [Rhodosporidiobolus azoricus]
MKLHWTIHKSLCGRPIDACYYPALNKEDRALLRRAKDLPFFDGGSTKHLSLMWYLAHVGLWRGDFEVRFASFSLFIRSYILVYVQDHVSEAIVNDRSIPTSRLDSLTFRFSAVWPHLSIDFIPPSGDTSR